MSIGRRSVVAGLAALALAAAGTGCSTKAKDTSSGTSTGGSAGAVKTGTGISGDTISLGELTDLTGIFAALGKNITQANQMYWDQKNAAGGVCGKKVTLVVKDHGYNVQTAVSLYGQVHDQVLAIEQMIGSPITTALSPQIQQDKMLTAPAAWATSLLQNPYVQITGATYAVEMVNGVDFLVKNKGLKSGDKLGLIYQDSEYGADGANGAKYAAQKNGLTVVEQKIKASDTDLTAQVTSLQSAGVKAIALTSAPLQTASVASVDKALGLNVPIIGNNPDFAPTLMATQAKGALEELFFQAQSGVPFSAPEAKDVAALYKSKFPNETPSSGVPYGYAVADSYFQTLDKACKAGDLTRDGVAAAHKQITNLDTKGLVAPLDLSKAGKSPTKQVYIVKPSSSDEGGLSVVQGLQASDNAKAYDG
jgi:ABC-type branched-subunit amino acid transport system substrate-binding protein